MSVSIEATRAVSAVGQRRFASAMNIAGCAWRALDRRWWSLVVILGTVYGLAQALAIAIGHSWPDAGFHDRFIMFARPAARWTTLMVALGCFLAFAGAVLREIGRRGVLRRRHFVLAVCSVTALAAIVADPIALAAVKMAHEALGATDVPFWAGVDWFTTLGRLWSLSMPTVLGISSMTLLVGLYIDKTQRSAEALASVQLRLADMQRRALAEQLHAAQATVEPTFLFGTLSLIEQCFEAEPTRAHALLDALIRYLRSAIPGTDDAVSTLGQQADLVRAYLDIECIRSAGRLRARVEVPASLQRRPFAPSLVLSLVTGAAAGVNGNAGVGRVDVKASLRGRQLVVQVDDDGRLDVDRRDAAELAALRKRLATLYGSQAHLTLDEGPLGGARAMIVIDDPGKP